MYRLKPNSKLLNNPHQTSLGVILLQNKSGIHGISSTLDFLKVQHQVTLAKMQEEIELANVTASTKMQEEIQRLQ